MVNLVEVMCFVPPFDRYNLGFKIVFRFTALCDSLLLFYDYSAIVIESNTIKTIKSLLLW